MREGPGKHTVKTVCAPGVEVGPEGGVVHVRPADVLLEDVLQNGRGEEGTHGGINTRSL